MGDSMIPGPTTDGRRESPAADDQNIALPPKKRYQGEFHTPHQPVQLLSWHSEPDKFYAPDPLPPDDVDMDAETPAVYQLASEVSSSHYAKRKDIYDEIDNYADKRQVHRKQSACLPRVNLCLTLVAMLIGAGGLGVGLYHLLFASSPECSCDDSIKTLESQLADSQTMLLELSEAVAELRTLNSTTDNNTRVRLDRLDLQVEEISTILATITSSDNTTSTANTSTTPRTDNLTIYNDCSSSMVSRCQIETVFPQEGDNPTYGLCETSDREVNKPGFYTLDLKCAVIDPDGVVNPIVTTLDVNEAENKARCLCYMTLFAASEIAQPASPDCGLFVTRCPITYSLDAD